jgi:putative SOS response-associated peptidase YedK
MCGKFTQMMSWGSLVYLADPIGASDGAAETIMPMRFANVIRLTIDGRREAARMRWGFHPQIGKGSCQRLEVHSRALRDDRHQTGIRRCIQKAARTGCGANIQ